MEIPTFYVRQRILESRPYQGELLNVAEKADEVEVAVEAQMGIMSSVRFAGYNDKRNNKHYAICGTRPIDNFIAREVQEYKHKSVPIYTTVDGKVFRFYLYEAAKSPNIVEASDVFEINDLVIQVGTLYRIPHLLCVCEVCRFKQEEKAELCSETGAPIFNRSGALIGVTMGRVAEDVFSAVPMEYLIQDFWHNCRQG